MKKFIFLVSFMLIFILLTSGYGNSYSKQNLQSVLIVYSSEDPFCWGVLENTRIVLDRNDIFYTDYDLSSNYTIPALDNFPLVAVVTDAIYQLPKGPQIDIKDYVKNGGKVVQLITAYSDEMAPIFGIADTKTPSLLNPVGGIKFEKDLFPGLRGLKIPPTICESVSYNVSLDKSAEIIARAYNGLPLAWKNSYGKGKTIFWNATLLYNKAYRGLIIASITSLLDVSVRKVIGSGIIFIDDMPSPSWKAQLEPIKSEYGITDTEYYSNIFLSDIISLGKKYNLKYTTVTIFNYNNLIKPPFTFYDWDNTSFVADNGNKIIVPEEMFKKLVEERAEVGFHGYNHIPFTLDQWNNQRYMKEAVLSAREKWFSIAKKPPRVYVPPMNVNDREGFNEVMEVFPSIEVYASLYLGLYDEGCDREFGPEPWNKNIVSIPRVTSGYIFDDYQRVLALSTLEAFGIWTHFLHPDDIFNNPKNYPDADPEWIRNPDSLPWRGDKSGGNGLYYKFEKEIINIKTLYPWLSFETALDAKYKILNYSESSTFTGVYADSIDLRESKDSLYIVELPSIFDLEKSQDFMILSNEKFGERRRVVIKVINGCKIYFKAS